MTERSAPGDRIVVTAAEQRRIDALAVARGASETALVESAGRSAAEWILGHVNARRAVVFAGPGGNGADALVIARRLRAARVTVDAFLLSPDGAASRFVMHALAALQDEGGGVTRIGPEDLGAVERALATADLAVDGLYGSSLSRPLGGPAAEIVRLVNAASACTVSLDVPSGVAADVGEILGPAVRANVTLAMEFLKPAHLLFPAAELCGKVEVVNVAYPRDALAAVAPWARSLDNEGMRRRLPGRPPTGHKGTFGHVLLVAGSAGMVGAAILSGRAALRAGAGLLTIAIPASQTAAVHAGLPEALVVSLAEDVGHITPAAVANLDASFRRASVLAIGPGLSRNDEACTAALAALEAFAGPVVVDADALYALSRHPESLKGILGRAILTPHPGEFAFLAGGDAGEIDRDRVTLAALFATRHGVIVVLKGRPTAIGLPDGRVYLNPTGNSGLAKGSTGDVLTGMIAGLIACGASLEDAALVGPYVHGRTAEIFARTQSERSLLASEIVDLLPRAFEGGEPCA